ncbi:hypothetical protein R3P38DRAFT_2827026 [Favolaschia claudopus]|uniref:F-box domain-containing protein n=1 Tax=Favolaschia claudopus TaxID=2862362 RepID=A0AAW0EI73_9AGAR
MSPAPSVIAELQEHLSKLALAIEVQKEILRDLEKQQSQALSRLNNCFDPVARLPLELQSEIFLCCLPSQELTVNTRGPPLLFLRVSRLWRDIALATPKLWAHLSIAFPRHSLDLCESWIKRAQHLPLSLTFYGDLVFGDRALDLLDDWAQQLHHLSLDVGTSRDADWSMRYISMVEDLPCLKTLSISSSDEIYFYDADNWLEILAAAPELVQLNLQIVIPEQSRTRLASSEPLVHESLERLQVTYPKGVLQHITLPGLKELSLEFIDFDPERLKAFLTRSSPKLVYWDLHPPSRWSPVMTDCLRLVPSLAHLFLHIGPVQMNIITLLATPSLNILPNLCHLTLQSYFTTRPEDVDSIIRMLSVRRLASDHFQKLESFRLIDQHPLNSDFAAALGKLAEDGMNIRVGKSRQDVE